MKEYKLDPLPDVTGDPAELFFDDREDCEFARTLAARTAASSPRCGATPSPGTPTPGGRSS